jgi:GNAT superfamily N-acetyltransferase
MPIAVEVAEFAEGLSAYTFDSPLYETIFGDGYVIGIPLHGPYISVQRIRLGRRQIPEVVQHARTVMRERGKTICSWWVSDWSTPSEIEPLLLTEGLAKNQRDYDIGALALTAQPPAPPEEVETQRVASLGEFLEGTAVAQLAFGMPDDRWPTREAQEVEYALEAESGAGASFVARIGGRIVGFGRTFFGPHGALLAGGATHPDARGRGVYRALVHARWNEAVARGTPALVVQAGAMSEPILERLGFAEVCRFRRLEDVVD